MDRRGRSRDVSPMAIARKALIARDQDPHRHDASTSRATRPRTSYNASLFDPQPHASTSRLDHPPCPLPSTSPVDSLLSRNNSSSTVDSYPSDAPIEPITPPDYACALPQSMPPDYYESPPSPPKSLQDQMQVAYARDNMHLAKVLLLKLQGIEVVGDDDPRIAAVKDEDFSSSFVPHGGLRLEEADERRWQEGQRREQERRRRKAREERLRAVEQVWEGSVQTVRYEKARAARRREEQTMERRRLEIEAREREKQRERERSREKEMQKLLRPLRTASGSQRTLLCYDSLLDKRSSKPSHSSEDLFRYPLPPSPPKTASSFIRGSSVPKQDTLSLTRFKREIALQHSRSIARSVSFTDVITSMHGPLFPADDLPVKSQNRSAAQVQLFESMFQTSDWGESERMEGKGKTRDPASKEARTNADTREQDPGTCVAVSQSSVETVSDSTLSSSASTITRTNSWFSFSSRRSTSTAITTPSSSPSSSLKSPPSSSTALPSSVALVTHSPRRTCQVSPLALVSSMDDPLSPPRPPPSQSKSVKAPSLPMSDRGRPLTRGMHASSLEAATGSDSDAKTELGLVRRVSRSVSSLMDLAAQFQRVYVRATLFSVGADLYAYSRSRSTSRGTSGSRSPSRRPRPRTRSKAALQPEGYRVRAADVAIFVAHPCEHGAPQPTRSLIPLWGVSGDAPRPTHERVFPLPPPIPRSPFRLPYPPPTVASRLRPVANPVVLRLQALQNVCAVRALAWEGRAKEGRMCAGKEKMVGVAWEGIGRSGLSWEVRDVC